MISYCSSVTRADCQLETLFSSERRQLIQYSADLPSQVAISLMERLPGLEIYVPSVTCRFVGFEYVGSRTVLFSGISVAPLSIASYFEGLFWTTVTSKDPCASPCATLITRTRIGSRSGSVIVQMPFITGISPDARDFENVTLVIFSPVSRMSRSTILPSWFKMRM
ncbi:Uncharacterised protein [Enterobacter hormaechei]|nr:Uncharacterised protein [Enterobacter hormaechei]